VTPKTLASRRRPARDRMPKIPRWSAERRTSGVIGREARARACGPASLAREGVAIHPERLSALRFPHLREEGIGKPRGTAGLARRIVRVLLIDGYIKKRILV
jgi:hypothetical protein